MKKCAYDCGQEAKYQLKNSKWCCSKSPNSCPILREKNSKSNKGRESTRGMLGKTHTEETIKNMSMDRKENPSRGMLGKTHTEQMKKEMSENRKGKGNTMYGREVSEETKRKIGKGNKGKTLSEEAKRKVSIASRRRWQDPEFQKKQKEGRAIRPNKPEQLLMELLEILYPNEWKYTGDFSFMINGKNPDFTNINGHKKLIELYGDYWHQGQDPEDRKSIFREFGYDTLVIWQSELKDLARTTFRIHRFMRK